MAANSYIGHTRMLTASWHLGEHVALTLRCLYQLEAAQLRWF